MLNMFMVRYKTFHTFFKRKKMKFNLVYHNRVILTETNFVDVDVGMREESIAARIEGLTIEGDIDNDSDGTQTGFLGATLELGGDSDKPHHVDRNRRASRKLIKGFY